MSIKSKRGSVTEWGTNPLTQDIASSADDALNIADENRRFDICLVFPVDAGAFAEGNPRFRAEGLQELEKILSYVTKSNMKLYLSVDKKEIYCLVRPPLDKVKLFADMNEYYLLADSKILKETCDAQKLEFANDRPDITRYDPYEHIYLKYEQEDEFQRLYYIAAEETTPFSDTMRVRILKHIFDTTLDQGGIFLQLERMAKRQDGKMKELKAIFPLHDKNKLFNLRCEWFSKRYILPWQKPFQMIREYFGEKITLYFHFVGESVSDI